MLQVVVVGTYIARLQDSAVERSLGVAGKPFQIRIADVNLPPTHVERALITTDAAPDVRHPTRDGMAPHTWDWRSAGWPTGKGYMQWKSAGGASNTSLRPCS